MKVAVSSNGENLDAQVDPRFGRCQFFLVVNPDDMCFEVLHNQSAAQAGGAGIQRAQFLASQGVAAVITGNCGPNAVQTLADAGIELIGGQAGTVRDAVKRFISGNLNPSSEATVDSHFGTNASAGSNRGGRMGAGRSAVRGKAMYDFGASKRTENGDQSRDQELQELKQQADSLNKKMKEVISRINRIEKK